MGYAMYGEYTKQTTWTLPQWMDITWENFPKDVPAVTPEEVVVADESRSYGHQVNQGMASSQVVLPDDFQEKAVADESRSYGHQVNQDMASSPVILPDDFQEKAVADESRSYGHQVNQGMASSQVVLPDDFQEK